MNNVNVVAIIQARIGSARLPGKVLSILEGQPMLWHQLKRLSYARSLNKIVVATTIQAKDDVIEEFCKKNSFSFFRGSEDDVLARYYHAAERFGADVVVRITADCPLIDPQVSDSVIDTYLKNRDACDGATNTVIRSYPRGLDTEAFSFQAIKRAYIEAKEPHQREHVTPYIYEHPELFKVKHVEYKEDLDGLRWTVDEAADLNFVREVYKELYEKDKIFFMKDILTLLKNRPELKEINRHVKQKAVIEEAKRGCR